MPRGKKRFLFRHVSVGAFWTYVGLVGTAVAALVAILLSRFDAQGVHQELDTLWHEVKHRPANYSSRQVLKISNVPGDYNQALNLDMATLYLTAPFSRDAVTLLWPTIPSLETDQRPIVTVKAPRADEQYKIPGGGATVEVPQAGRGLEVRGLKLVGQAQRITFDIEHPTRLIRDGEHIFRISLVSVADNSDRDRSMFLEYEFAVSEVDNNAENLAAAITQEQHVHPRPGDQEVQDALTAMDSLPVGTITLRLREVVDGRPNMVQLSAHTKSFLFDPIARVATFRMRTNAGRSVNLTLPLGVTSADGRYFIAFVWDVSKGARLHVNDTSVDDGLQ